MVLIWLLIIVGILALIGNYAAFRSASGSTSPKQFVRWMLQQRKARAASADSW